MFGYGEQIVKRPCSASPRRRPDALGVTFGMAIKPRKGRQELYAQYRETSGWWLAAWRDYRGLTLEDLADELGMSKGYVSDLETGATRGSRPPTRFNRDTVQAVAKAVGTTGGRLLDVNPYDVDERSVEIESIFRDLDDPSRDALIQMAETLRRRTA